MKTMSVIELKKLLDSKEVHLVDVREPAEHRSESIDGARLIRLNEVSIGKLSSKSLPTVFHCRSGARSANACTKLLEEDSMLDIYSLEGGIVAWSNAGFNTKKSAKYMLPLDRQMQLTVGFFVFSSTVLGTLLNSVFYVIPALMGVGLMFAGITGFCGMARILARMPWNK